MMSNCFARKTDRRSNSYGTAPSDRRLHHRGRYLIAPARGLRALNQTQTLEMIPGSIGAFIDDIPLLTTAQVRPYVVATLLHRGAVRHHEIIASLTPHCRIDDLKVGAWDPLEGDYCEGTRLERLVDEVLGEFVSEGLVRYNQDQDLWVLTPNDLPRIISWVAALGAKMPAHLLSEMSRQQIAHLPDNAL